MATDFDAPRRGIGVLDSTDVDVASIGRVADDLTRTPDLDPLDVETLVLPDADLSGEELVVTVEPMRADEFRCGRCFLVQARHLVAEERGDTLVCRDCAG
jgi:hypothetical protein